MWGHHIKKTIKNEDISQNNNAAVSDSSNQRKCSQLLFETIISHKILFEKSHYVFNQSVIP